MKKLVVIDGNSILNRAFYGIMGNKMLQTADGTYTNAVYGFLNIMFKMLEEINPQYLVVAFDVKHPTKRHEIYKEYKGTRKGMPDELASQMPIMKQVLEAMNITVIEMPGYEADDILGTLARIGEEKGLQVTLLTGDRDSFQLATNKVTIRIPRTKQGKTEVEDFNEEKIIETYGVLPKQLIEVKGLMGDTSDNIPGVPGVGEKTALNLIKEFKTIDALYEALSKEEDGLKDKLKEKLQHYKDLAYLSKQLGTIDVYAPIEYDLEDFRVVEWDNEKILEIFKQLRFNRFIERFHLEEYTVSHNTDITKNFFAHEIIEENRKEQIEAIFASVRKQKKMYYCFETEVIEDDTYIIKKEIKYINIYEKQENKVYTLKFIAEQLKDLFEDHEIIKCGYAMKTDYILLRQNDILPQNMMFDASIGVYLLNATSNAYSLEEIAKQYLNLEIQEIYNETSKEIGEQTSLFDEPVKEETPNYQFAVYAYVIGQTENMIIKDLEKINALTLFYEIEMPTAEVLASMQFEGIYVDEKELLVLGEDLKKHIEALKVEIYDLAGVEFNINSTKQLGEILFEKLKLTPSKKTKSGYSTDVDALEKIKREHPIIEKILNYRQLMKLNSTYVEGMRPYINPKTKRIHTFFHQTVTATGRISSTDPNLQNIPTRTDLGKMIRKVFKAEEGKILIDADYSQIELRVLAHVAKDEMMINAFRSDADIHTISASQVFNIPIEEVTKEIRSRAKAVNFGIVYGISDFGLAEQIAISRKEAKQYINQYLATYQGIRKFMETIVEEAKEKGFVETLCNRRRYIPELKSNNYMVRKFGDRVAMNTPIQGTAADIMKMAMIQVYQELKKRKLQSKIVLQVHDELLVETVLEEKDIVIKILRDCMEHVIQLRVPLKVDIGQGNNWLEAK